MNHHDAVRLAAVEKFLLNELPADERDEFEEHFFECPECAADLRVTAAFLDAARSELRRHPVPASPLKSRQARWFATLFKPAVAAPAFALLLLVIVYQDVGMTRRPDFAAVPSTAPEVLTTLSLAAGNSRGADAPSMALPLGVPFLTSVDIPADDRYSRYGLELVSPAGTVVWSLPVSAQQAKDTVFIRIPGAGWAPGSYALVVRGYAGSDSAPVALAHYRFTLNAVQ